MKKDVRLVIVSWLDSGQPSPSWEWMSTFTKKKPIQCATVGWLIQDDDDVKVLCQSVGDLEAGDDCQMSGVMPIPTVCVQKIETLREID